MYTPQGNIKYYIYCHTQKPTESGDRQSLTLVHRRSLKRKRKSSKTMRGLGAKLL